MSMSKTIELSRGQLTDAVRLWLREISGERGRIEGVSFVHDPNTGRVVSVQVTLEAK